MQGPLARSNDGWWGRYVLLGHGAERCTCREQAERVATAQTLASTSASSSGSGVVKAIKPDPGRASLDAAEARQANTYRSRACMRLGGEGLETQARNPKGAKPPKCAQIRPIDLERKSVPPAPFDAAGPGFEVMGLPG